MMAFLYSFLTLFQPGIFWPVLSDFRPMMIISIFCLFAGLATIGSYIRHEVFLHPASMCLLCFIGVEIISLFSHGINTGLAGLAFFGTYLFFFVVSLTLICNQRNLVGYVWGTIAGGLFIVGFGIYAVMNGMPNAIGGRAGAYGMYENHNDYSFVIIQILPFLYMARKITRSLLIRSLLGAGFIACIVGILLSLSRGGMLALLLEILLIVMIGMQGKKRLWWLPILVLVGSAAISYQWSKRAENQGNNYTAADAENSRLELWRAGGAMLADHPLLGVGAGQFAENAQFYGEISHDNLGKNSHNTYLEILTGTGLLGFTLFVGFIVQLLCGLHRISYPHVSATIDAIRRATLIATYSILLRATLDAKGYDWSFYMLGVIGIGCIILHRRLSVNAGLALVNSSFVLQKTEEFHNGIILSSDCNNNVHELNFLQEQDTSGVTGKLGGATNIGRIQSDVDLIPVYPVTVPKYHKRCPLNGS